MQRNKSQLSLTGDYLIHIFNCRIIYSHLWSGVQTGLVVQEYEPTRIYKEVETGDGSTDKFGGAGVQLTKQGD